MLVLSRFIVNCLLLLVLTYIGCSEDLTDCPDGEQGDEQGEPITCEPSDNASKIVDCSFMMVMNPDDYESINCLKIVNQGNETVAGTPEIALGGVDYTYIMGDVFSQPGQGVNYTLTLWTKQINKSDTTTSPTTTTKDTTITETTNPVTTSLKTTITTTKIETTTGGSVRNSLSQILLFIVFTYYVIGSII